MLRFFSPVIGKFIRKIVRLFGAGSAFPGLFIETINPYFIKNTLQQLPLGTVVVSGTNGKTTTTKIIVELLKGQGLKVFTNKTGSNFARGVAAALIKEINLFGKIDADIAVLELDEAHAVHFVKKIKPKYTLLLNIMRDQLDRFGEIDNITKMLRSVALATTDTVILNREDGRIRKIADDVKDAGIKYFGLSDKTRHLFFNGDDVGVSNKLPRADIIFESIDYPLSDISSTNKNIKFLFDKKEVCTELKIQGIYNIFNAAAALAVARIILQNKNYYNENNLINTLSKVKPAFGRGEKINLNGDVLEIILVKNPTGFLLGLSSFISNNHKTMIAINDQYADGRDISWLWDVDFKSLKKDGVEIVAGTRAYDMSLRLQHDNVHVNSIEPDLITALRKFNKNTKGFNKHIFCTYTAMIALRKELSKITEIEVII